MIVKATRSAIKAYAQDLSARGQGVAQRAEAEALETLLGVFKGLLGAPFQSFSELVSKVELGRADAHPNAGSTVARVIRPLERLADLMVVVSTANRQQDMQALISLLRRHESASISEFVNAVQFARRGPDKRPPMSLDDLKQNLDASLGDDETFNKILADLRELNEEDFRDVAVIVLRVPFKSKKQGLERLIRLHKSTRAHRLKQAVMAGRSAA